MGVTKQFPLFNELVAFVIERHRIYLKKHAGKPKPWTADPILQQFKFCNVYRELDKVTVWIRDSWREPYRADPNIWFAMVVARLVNWPESLQAVTDAVLGSKRVCWEPALFTEIMDQRKLDKQQLFTGAYMIHADATPTSSKAGYLAERVLTPMWDNRSFASKYTGGLGNFHNWLMSFRDMGSFMAAQVIADTKYTNLLAKADGWDTWAAPGPGSQRGLNRVMGREVKAPWKAEEWLAQLQDLRVLLNVRLGRAGMEPLHAQDVQNCLCEFSKYTRGYSRSKYPGV